VGNYSNRAVMNVHLRGHLVDQVFICVGMITAHFPNMSECEINYLSAVECFLFSFKEMFNFHDLFQVLLL
jgi:hypothetical protein